MIRSRQRISRRYVWLGLLLVVAGCGPAKTDVSGTVRYQGKPLTFGNVLVVDADGMPHTSLISDEGSYAASGVPVGPVRFAVLVSDMDVNKLPKRKASERRGKFGFNKRGTSRRDNNAPPPKPLLPPRYAAVGTSGLSTNLQPGSNTFNLDLE
jgi:hypothetical protein